MIFLSKRVSHRQEKVRKYGNLKKDRQRNFGDRVIFQGKFWQPHTNITKTLCIAMWPNEQVARLSVRMSFEPEIIDYHFLYEGFDSEILRKKMKGNEMAV